MSEPPKKAWDSYEQIAERYAASVDDRPWNAHYERPAMLALLPPLQGAAVLDVGCGSGWYAVQMIARGARVTSFDLNSQFVELTRARVGDRGRVLRADLARPLDFAFDDEFDVAIAPLVMHYLEDWVPPLKEIRRALKPGGILLFSTHHPFWDWQHFERDDYFATEIVEDEWEAVGKVRFYRRPLTAISEALRAAGFAVERLVEPQPTGEFKRVSPGDDARLRKQPGFLIVRAFKPR